MSKATGFCVHQQTELSATQERVSELFRAQLSSKTGLVTNVMNTTGLSDVLQVGSEVLNPPALKKRGGPHAQGQNRKFTENYSGHHQPLDTYCLS